MIGCVSVDLSVTNLNSEMKRVKPPDDTIVAIVDIETGALIANSEDNGVLVSDYETLSDIHVEKETVDYLLSDVRSKIEKGSTEQWSSSWVESAFSNAIYNCTFHILAAYPLPVPPTEYNPEYLPRYIVVQAASESIFAPVSEFEESIDDEIRSIAFVTVAIGVFTLVATLAFVWCVARMFTRPLKWIEQVSKSIVQHAEKTSVPIDGNGSSTVRWSPNTEIIDLVAGFQQMIEGFSGTRPPVVAEVEYFEIENTITWQSDYHQLYEKGLDSVKHLFSSVSETTPLTEEESRELSNPQNHRSFVRKLRGSVSAKKAEAPVRRHSDFIPAFKRNSDVTQGRSLSFVSGSFRMSEHFSPEERKSFSVVPAPPKQNLGFNIPDTSIREEKMDTTGWLWVTRSKLFRWILLLLVTPLILAIITICVLVTIDIVSTVPKWVDTLEEESLDLSRQALASVALLKSRLIEEMFAEPVRDLYTMSRVANWIHSGAIPHANTFTETDYATEECKIYERYQCPLYRQPGRFPCPCEWGDDPAYGTCNEKMVENTRPFQKRFYSCQSKAADPITGNRLSGSGKVLDDSPNATEWWGDVKELPGAPGTEGAALLATTYNRAKISSTFSVVEFPVFNYATALRRPKHHLGTYTAYEADGLFSGFGGCSYNYPNYAQFVSTLSNRANETNPLLCPIGEYGYDPRCRPWYEETRREYEKNSAFIHLTPPYLFLDTFSIGLSAVSPILDSSSGIFLGEVLLDFAPYGILEAFESIGRPISFLVAIKEDSFGGDTIVGPNRTKGWSSAQITDELFLGNDGKDASYRRVFEETLLVAMKQGESGTAPFYQVHQNGNIEVLTMSFHPVYQRFLRPVNSRDSTRGAEVDRRQVYAIGIAAYDEELTAPFRNVKDDMLRDLHRLAIIDIVLTVSVAAIFITFAVRVSFSDSSFNSDVSKPVSLFVTSQISIYLAKPMILLLHAVESINSGEAKDEIQPLGGGSREFSQVYTSFSKLNKIVGVSNKAFFSGSIDWAYHFIYDALQLFRKVDDQKAIGIACNNLGNTIFAMAMQGQPLWVLNADGGPSVTYQTALDYYDEAIDICRRAFDSADDSFLKAEYAQHLADRLFNRGLYLLFIQDESDDPGDYRNRGLDDIARARDLDYDVQDFFLEKRLVFQNSDQYFCRLIRRIFGLSTYCHDEELKKIWNVRDVIHDADSLLFAAWNEASAPVFKDLGRVNRLQQLEAAALRLELCEGNTAEAARMGMRMLAEDEYILESAFPVAATAILESMRSDDGISWSQSTCQSLMKDLRRMSSACRNVSLDLGKCFIFALELNERWEGGPLLEKVKSHCLRIFDKTCTDEDYVGVAAYTVRGDQTLGLGRKRFNADQQREMLDVATTSTSEMVSPSLPYAMQMVVDSGATSEKDSFILLFTDGYSWDPSGYRSIKEQIEKMNRERKTSIHLIIVGLDIEDEEVVEECKAMCSISQPSFFVEVTLENVDAVFASIISVVNPLQLRGPSLCGITMEKF